MRDIGPAECDVAKPVQAPVVDEVAQAAQQPAVLAPGDTRTDQTGARQHGVRSGRHRHDRGPARYFRRARNLDDAGISPAPV